MDAEPKPNEVRQTPNGRTFVVLGDAGDGRDPSDNYRYVEPHTLVMETGGAATGTRFAVPTRSVAEWTVLR